MEGGSHQIRRSLTFHTAPLAFGILTEFLLVHCCLQELQALEKQTHNNTSLFAPKMKVVLSHLEWQYSKFQSDPNMSVQLLGGGNRRSRADTDLHLRPGCLWGCREADQVLMEKVDKREIRHQLLRWLFTDAAQRARVTWLTVAVHPVIRGVRAEVSRVVLTPVRVQVAGEALRGGRTAADQEPEQHTCDSCLPDYSRFVQRLKSAANKTNIWKHQTLCSPISLTKRFLTCKDSSLLGSPDARYSQSIWGKAKNVFILRRYQGGTLRKLTWRLLLI